MIKISINQSQYNEALKVLEPKNFKKAARYAFNRTSTSLNKTVVSTARKIFTIKTEYIKRGVGIRKNLGGDLNKMSITLSVSEKRWPITNFSYRQRRVTSKRGVRYGVSSKIYKTKKMSLQKGVFLGKGKNSGKILAFKRANQDDNKSKLIVLTGPSVGVPYSKPEGQRFATKIFSDKFNKNFSHAVKYFLSTQKS